MRRYPLDGAWTSTPPRFVVCFGGGAGQRRGRRELAPTFGVSGPAYPEGVTRSSRVRPARTSLPRDVIVLGVVSFFVMLGFGVVIPVLPVYARSFGVGYVEVGMVVAIFAVMRLVANPFVGPLANRLGERALLAIGIGIVAVSSALVGIAQDYTQMLIFRGIGGIGSAMFSVSAMSLLLAAAAPSIRGRALGFYQGGFLVGGMAGPAVGGVLSAISLQAPFFFYAGTLAVAGLVGLFLLSTRRGVKAENPIAPRPFRQVLRDRRFQAANLANFAQGWASMGVRSALVPVLVVEFLHQEPAMTGIAFAVAAVAQTIALAPAGRFVDRVGRRPAIVGASLLAGATIALLPAAGELWQLIVLLAVYGVAAAFLGTAPAAAMGDAAGGRAGTPVAVFQASGDAGAIAGPLVAGFLAEQLGMGWGFASAGILLAASAIFAMTMSRETRAGTAPADAAAVEPTPEAFDAGERSGGPENLPR